MKKTSMSGFFEQVKQEARKVSWPDWSSLWFSVAMVVAVVFVLSLVTVLLDYCIHGMVRFMLNLGR